MSTKALAFSGLQGNTYGGATFKSVSEVEAEIAAAKNNFFCDTVRLQIQQQLLVGDNGTSFDATYLSTVNTVVSYALSLGLIVVINCQTEKSSGTRLINYPGDTSGGASASATNNFWQHIDSSWHNTANVIYDIFNEPDGAPGVSGGNWSVWQTAMNGLISYIQTTLGATNTLWCDADNYAASFSGCPGLTGTGLVYSFHHPTSGPGGDTAGWDTDFGNWSATHSVVNGEFAQNATYNWRNNVAVSDYLSYLTTKSIGLAIWTTMTTGTSGDIADANLQPFGWFGGTLAHYYNPAYTAPTYTGPSVPALPAGYVPTAADMNQLSSAAQFLLARPFAYANATSAQALTASTLNVINLGVKVFDNDGMWASGAANRLTVQTQGWYHARYGCPTGGTNNDGALYVTTGAANPAGPGVTTACWGSGGGATAPTGYMAWTGGGLVPFYLYQGDYVQIKISPSSAVSTDVSDAGPWLSLEWAGV